MRTVNYVFFSGHCFFRNAGIFFFLFSRDASEGIRKFFFASSVTLTETSPSPEYGVLDRGPERLVVPSSAAVRSEVSAASRRPRQMEDKVVEV